MTLNRSEMVIWASGFFDGEGCVSLSCSRKKGREPSHTMRLTVFQIVREPLDLLQWLFGGTVKRRNPAGTSSAGWCWAIGGAQSADALEEMLPFLLVKHAQAIVAVAFQRRRLPSGQKHGEGAEAARALDAQDHETLRTLKLVREA